MPKRETHARHPLILLRRMLEMSRKELAAVLFPGTDGNVVANPDQTLGDCERGKNSLKNKTSALWQLVRIFGARPDGFTSSASMDIKALSGGYYTPLWYFAWTFAGSEPDPRNPPPIERLALARRIHRANELYGAYVRREDPDQTGLAVLEKDYEDNDDETPIDSRLGLDVLPKDKLFDDRDRLAREMFESISREMILPERDDRGWLFELNALTHAFQLLPVFHLLEGS